MKRRSYGFILALMLATMLHRTQTMTTSVGYLPTAELVKRAEAARSSHSNLPVEAIQGYPVPLRYGGRMALVFPFFNIHGKPPKAPEVMPPRWIIYIDAITGGELAIIERKDDFTKSLGRHEMEKMTITEVQDKQQRIFRLYDILIPIAFDKAPRSKETSRDVEELRHLWRQIVHKPLTKFYREISPSWFDFVGLE